MSPSAGSPAITLIMPTIDWGPTFQRCLQAAAAAAGPADPLLVVFDGTPPPPPDWLLAAGATLLQTDKRQGPAAARNLAASRAPGPILLFVDADVALHPDAVERVRAAFAADPDLAAVFGSYDATPSAPGLVSQFRNLLHHHTHTSHHGPASTFWAGCGAVRRERFLSLGGFDAQTYHQPSIEDIEFGLRLHEVGGRILLDPTIRGTHHKRWTLDLMLQTDIRQRAIPWSRLILQSKSLPATLNLSPAARWSAASSLVAAGALLGLAVPALRLWCLLVAGSALLLFVVLNQTFLALLLRQGGLPLLSSGTALHLLYQLYSSLTFLGVLGIEAAQAPLRTPSWLKRHPALLPMLARTGLALLSLLVLVLMGKGVVLLLQSTGSTDLHERYDEWLLFRAHIFPSGALASPEQRALPHFRTSVYLPWALPLFGLLFAWGGIWQGKLIMLLGSFSALGIMAWLGWLLLRPWGRGAGLLGLLSPLAINGNANCLVHGQFSIVCMGLITLQWLLLQRSLPIPAGVCWALAMVKPQIAFVYAVPFFRPHRISGFLVASGLLLGLSTVALAHTRTSPWSYLLSWFAVLPVFINKGNGNALGGLVSLYENNPIALCLFALSFAIVFSLLMARFMRVLPSCLAKIKASLRSPDSLQLSACCGLLGMIVFYHIHLDTIMIYPALLVCWRNAFLRPKAGNLLVAILMAISAWTPESLLYSLPVSKAIQISVWTLVALLLLARLLRPSPQSS